MSDKMTRQHIRGDYSPLDVQVGFRVHLRRIIARISEEQLADALQVRPSVVHEFEQGIRPIGASLLYHISILLRVPLGNFFASLSENFDLDADLDPIQSDEIINSSDVSIDQTTDHDNEIVELVQAYQSITLNSSRRRMLDLMKALAHDKSE